jgi:hypothetical protein
VKRLLAIAILALCSEARAQPVGPLASFCSKSFQVSAGATALTQFVAAQSGQRIQICGYVINAGAAAGTFQLEYGTGTNCGTGTQALTPAWSLGINGVLSNRGLGVGESTPLGQALCYVITGTGPVGAVVYWDQY